MELSAKKAFKDCVLILCGVLISFGGDKRYLATAMGFRFGVEHQPSSHDVGQKNVEGFFCKSNQHPPCNPENDTCNETCQIHPGLNLGCYALWKNTTEDGVKILLQGCWDSQPEMEHCHASKCSTDKLQSQQKAGAETYFCCCETSNCNDEIFFEPKIVPKEDSRTISPAYVPDDNSEVFTGVVFTLVPICFLAIFTFMGYWIWRRYKFCKRYEGSQMSSTVMTHAPSPLISQIDLNNAYLISRGRYGAVYRALMGDKVVAVKKFPAQDWESWAQEQDIYQVAALRNHDNVLRYVGAEVRGSGPLTEYFLITMFHENGSLYDYLKAHIVTYKELLHISITMLRGLAFLHEEIMGQGDRNYKPTIVHRDFKSRNVLLKKDLTACVGDFGLALKCEHGRTSKDTHGQVGTRRYMAPEVLEGATEFSAFAFKQIDVYAAALVLWEVLSRCAIGNGPVEEFKLPFEEECGTKPTLSEIQNVVVTLRKRPCIKDAWLQHDRCHIICQTIQEMWDSEFEARVTAGGALERFISLEPAIYSNHYSLLLSSTSTNDRLQESSPLIMDFSNSSSVV